MGNLPALEGQDRPQSDLVIGGKSERATIASLGLAGVVACLAVFSIFSASTTQTQVAQVQHDESLHRSYDRAITAIHAEDTSMVEYLLAPSPERRALVGEATNELFNAINEVETYGGTADAQLAKDVLAFHDRYVVASARVIAAVVAGDTVEARRIDLVEADPIFEAMQDRITEAAVERAAEADIAFQALRSSAQWMFILAPVVFAIGFALLSGLWRILRRTYREIEQLSKLRSEFVSIVSHEFRTPLTGIQGFSEMLRDEVLTMPQVREYAGDINKDAQRLARLITDMLDLDRMESGRMNLNSEPVDLNCIVAETAAQFRLSAADHPIELDLDPRLLPLMGDSDRLTQIVTNLLSNAIKYSPSGGAVEIRTRRAERTVTLTVRDHGMGIASEQLEKIFERYTRVETAANRAIQGIGLGLPIVRQIVHLSDGRVWATSEPGDGSVFHVQLPLVDATSLAPLAA